MSPDPPPRRAAVVLVTPDGTPIGRLPEVPVATRWWPDVQAIVQAVREAYGIEVVVLRMLDSELPRPHGGGVTYLAETAQPHRAVAARRRVPAPVRRHARRPAAPPALGRSPAARTATSPGPRTCSRAGGSSASDPRSRCAAGTCPASGACRSRTARRRGSRSCRRSSPTRATCCAASSPTPFRGSWAPTATACCSPTSRATTSTTRPSPSCSRWCRCWSTSRPPGSAVSTTCWRSACPTGGGRG